MAMDALEHVRSSLIWFKALLWGSGPNFPRMSGRQDASVARMCCYRGGGATEARVLRQGRGRRGGVRVF